MAFDIELEFHLPVSTEKVMRLLTEPELIKAWSENGAVLENNVGGKVILFDDWVTGVVLKTTADELSYTWAVIDWEKEVEPTVVHYTLIPENGATRIELKHTGFASEEEMVKHEGGWTEYFFAPMENYILKHDF